MTDQELFTRVGIREASETEPEKRLHGTKGPWISGMLLLVIVLGCLFAECLMNKDPLYLDLQHCNLPPSREFFFGTDRLGRDIFSGIWYGGRISIVIGCLATLISTVIAMVYGSFSGLAPTWLDRLMMRGTEMVLSIPNLLLVLFLQGMLGQASVWSLSVVMGISGWAGMAKVIRTEVRQLRASGYVVASRCMGGGFLHVLFRHLMPNFVASILFMVVMQVRSAMISESTLSFLGMGLPIEMLSWGGMLSVAQQALMTGSWWAVLIPGLFLVIFLMCLTNVGHYLQAALSHRESHM